MENSVVFSGFGGQGILFVGQILARGAIRDGSEAFWIPSYGPEMRGGTAASTVIIGDKPIGSPVIDRPDAAVVMNQPSFEKFGPRVAAGGLLIVNASLVHDSADRSDIEQLQVPCTELAEQAGSETLVSMVALGALIGNLGLVSPEAIREALSEVVAKKRPAALDANLSAFNAGLRFAAEHSVPEEAPAVGTLRFFPPRLLTSATDRRPTGQ